MMTVLDAFQCFQSRLEIATCNVLEISDSVHIFVCLLLMPSYCVVRKTAQELATALLMTYSYILKICLLNTMLCTLHLKLK